MQVKYNAKAMRHISSTIDYYLEHFGKQATTNLAPEIDEKVKTLRDRFPRTIIERNAHSLPCNHHRSASQVDILCQRQHTSHRCFLGYAYAFRKTKKQNLVLKISKIPFFTRHDKKS